MRGTFNGPFPFSTTYRQQSNGLAAPLADAETPGIRRHLRRGHWRTGFAVASCWAVGGPTNNGNQCCTCGDRRLSGSDGHRDALPKIPEWKYKVLLMVNDFSKNRRIVLIPS